VRPGRLPAVAWVQSVAYVLRLARRLARLRPDLVHTNTLKAALYGGMAARIAGIPCVWHVRDRIASDYLPSSAVHLVRVAARTLPTAVIANSDATLQTLAMSTDLRNGLVSHAMNSDTLKRVRFSAVIPSPVLVPPAKPEPSLSSSAGFRVAMVGRLAPWKGQSIFLQAFARAFPNGEEAAVLVGSALFAEDEYERQLRDLVCDLCIEERVEFRGFRSAVFEELNSVDALVHASIIPEPFGQVILEGMAAGLPVLAVGAGGPAEILVEGETGLFYPAGDVDALASLLRRVADDVVLRSRLGANAREAVVKYSPERVAEQIVDVYERVLQRPIPKQSGVAGVDEIVVANESGRR
jgi:glycosyltransferase involved in cell wall biosynthesis